MLPPPGDWPNYASPAELFVRLWQAVSSISPSIRAMAPPCEVGILAGLEQAMEADEPAVVLVEIGNICAPLWPVGSDPDAHKARVSIVLAVMAAIDRAALRVHPRTVCLAASTIEPDPLPDWLSEINATRLLEGAYWENDEVRLVPNGPFGRHARGRAASCADTVQDRFCALAVAPTQVDHKGRRLNISMRLIDESAANGVPVGDLLGRETVGMVPIAEDAIDLVAVVSMVPSGQVVDIRPGDKAQPFKRFLAGIDLCPDLDIAVAPELTMSADDIKNGSEELRNLPKSPRMLVAGSALSSEVSTEGLAWNEAQVFNSLGYRLWSQRKNWPFGMSKGKAAELQLADLQEDEMLMENVSAHDTLTIADIDTLGRCVVLICQDFEMASSIEDLLAAYQPDWVFVPILDPGVRSGGWTHQRALSLSRSSQARFIICSSLTMFRWYSSPPSTEQPFALVVGPMNPTPSLDDSRQPDRAVAEISSVTSASPRHGWVSWRHASSWQQTWITVKAV